MSDARTAIDASTIPAAAAAAAALPPLLQSLRDFPAPAGDDAAREDAMAHALAGGLPTQRAERWKYTSLRPLGARRFVQAARAPALHPELLADVPSPRLVFVNGRFDAGLSELGPLAPGLHFAPASSSPGDAFDAWPVAAPGADPADVFARLNVALATDGLVLEVADGIVADAPLHLVCASVAADGDLAMHLRHRVRLGAGARATLVEHHLAAGAHRHLSNHAMHVVVGERAQLVHARLQDEDAGATLLARTDARVGAAGGYRRLDLELGAGLARHELNVLLAGEGASVDAGGALLATGRGHIDTRLDVLHAARDTRCNLPWRGLAADRGKLAFHGGIRIAAGADGAAATLSSKNLLLSEQAEVNTQPVLEIDADEVQAAHGATVGRLDPTALFYLRSRGVPLAEARALLTLAFCREALASLGDDALAALLSPPLEARLPTLVEASP